MKRTSLRLGAVSACVLAAALASPAYAANTGTLAGTDIKNTVSVDYNVGNIAQTQLKASDTFKVDRKVALTVTSLDTSTVSVSPGQTAAVTKFSVYNGSNATLDFALSVSQQTGGAGAHSGTTDNFDVTSPTIYVDTNGNGSYDPGTDQAVTYLDEIAPDGSKTVFVVANIPVTQVTGDAAAVILSARAAEGGTAGNQGANVVQSNILLANDNSAMETVFADTAGAATLDVARDGQHSAKDDYTVLGATLTVTKVSSVISDPVNGSVMPRMIPGAVVQYCITVKNASGGAAASNVAITDALPTTLTYLSSFGIKLNGTVVALTGACNSDGSSGGNYNAGTVTGTINTVAAGDARTVVFQATVN